MTGLAPSVRLACCISAASFPALRSTADLNNSCQVATEVIEVILDVTALVRRGRLHAQTKYPLDEGVVRWIAISAPTRQSVAVRQNVVDAPIDTACEHTLDDVHRLRTCAAIEIASHEGHIVLLHVHPDPFGPKVAQRLAAIIQRPMRVRKEDDDARRSVPEADPCHVSVSPSVFRDPLVSWIANLRKDRGVPGQWARVGPWPLEEAECTQSSAPQGGLHVVALLKAY